ncbi:MAG: response regulator transcription factor [Planctomycetes bacterium]|nr:response regulator transcription factor [Planctomycetota bacterium]
MPVKLLILDSREIVRAGLRALLDDAQLDIVGEASNLSELQAALSQGQPHVITLGGLSHTETVAAIANIKAALSDSQVLTIGSRDDRTLAARAKVWGASDFVPDDFDGSEILKAVRTAAAAHGKPAANGKTAANGMGAAGGKKGASKSSAAAPPSREKLSPREAEVLAHLGSGLANNEIAIAMQLKIDSVRKLVRRVLQKLKLTDRTQAAVWAARREAPAMNPSRRDSAHQRAARAKSPRPKKSSVNQTA